MRYENVIAAKFLSRPNRFIAHVEVDGRAEVAHVKNTGRCRELLAEGATVYLAVSDNPERKTKYDLIAVEKVREGKPPKMGIVLVVGEGMMDVAVGNHHNHSAIIEHAIDTGVRGYIRFEEQ